MAVKTLTTRVQQKSDTSANWAKATNFTPLKGEIIVYTDLRKIKIGDGVTKVGALEFANSKDAETLTGASLSTILNSSDVEIPTSKAVLDALNGKVDKADAGSDWNQNDETAPDYIKNRPFYEDIETVSTTVNINWDGTTTGLVTSVITYWDGSTEKGHYCKISDDIFTKEQFLQMYFVRDGSEITVTEDMLNFNSYVVTYGADSSPVIVIKVGGGIPGGPSDEFTETGIYFPSNGCVTKLASRQPIENTTTTIKKIDEEFMPDSIIEAINSITNKMDTTNPVATGSFSMNRKDGTTIGTKSHAEGNSTTASGNFSHAEGAITIASKESSHAEGSETVASGRYSHAEGFRTTSRGDKSHSEGNSSNIVPDTILSTAIVSDSDIITNWNSKNFLLANGMGSHAEGIDTLALGDYSHAEGTRTIASAESSHAEGNSTTASGGVSHAEGENTTASGSFSHAEGYLTTASGSTSHAEGNYTTASGSDSHAEGFQTTASGDYGSHAEGRETTASGYCSHAEGFDTKASSDNQHVQGKFNIEDSSGTYVHIVGNGTADTARSNAHTLDWSGNVWFAGDVYTGSTSGTNKDEGSKKLATEEYVDSKQVQPDWNQNDDTQPDYIKNRPFYTGDPVETVLVEESTVSFTENNGLYGVEFPSTFEATVGETYKVYWDGTVYECVCENFNNMPVIGNLSIMGAGSDTGEPFIIGVDNGKRIAIVTVDTSASHTFSISGFVQEVVKIDPKYIRDMYYTTDPVETVLVEERTIAFADSGKGFYEAEFQSTFSAKVGDTYKVYWDGSAYECTCVAISESHFLFIGNTSIVGAGSDTGEPFIIGVNNGKKIMIATADTATSHTFSISGFVSEVVKID